MPRYNPTDAAVSRLQQCAVVHRRTLEYDLNLGPSDPRFTARMRDVKQAAALKGLSVVSVDERIPWWTSEPTDIDATIHLMAVSRRHQGERERDALILGVRAGSAPLGAALAELQAARIRGEDAALKAFVDQWRRQHRATVVTRIDQLIAQGRSYGP